MAANCCRKFVATPEHWLGHPSVPDFMPVAGFHAYVIQNLVFHIRNCYTQGVSQQLSNLRHFLESQAYREWVETSEEFIYDEVGDGVEFKRGYGSAVPFINDVGKSLLFVACMAGHELIVKVLLDNNVGVGANGDDDTDGLL